MQTNGSNGLGHNQQQSSFENTTNGFNQTQRRNDYSSGQMVVNQVDSGLQTLQQQQQQMQQAFRTADEGIAGSAAALSLTPTPAPTPTYRRTGINSIVRRPTRSNVDRSKLEYPIDTLLWPPLERMNLPGAPPVRANLAEYIRDDPRAGNQSDDWGFIFNEREYSDCHRSTQEKLVSHIQGSCAEQGFSMTVHTWANKEERGTLRIRLKCSHNRRSKCKFSFQLCFGLTECFWYLRRGSGKHIHTGHELDHHRCSEIGNNISVQQDTTNAGKRQPESAPLPPTKRRESPTVNTSNVVGTEMLLPSFAVSPSASRMLQQQQQNQHQTVEGNTSFSGMIGQSQPQHSRVEPFKTTNAAVTTDSSSSNSGLICLPTNLTLNISQQPQSVSQQEQLLYQQQQSNSSLLARSLSQMYKAPSGRVSQATTLAPAAPMSSESADTGKMNAALGATHLYTDNPLLQQQLEEHKRQQFRQQQFLYQQLQQQQQLQHMQQQQPKQLKFQQQQQQIQQQQQLQQLQSQQQIQLQQQQPQQQIQRQQQQQQPQQQIQLQQQQPQQQQIQRQQQQQQMQQDQQLQQRLSGQLGIRVPTRDEQEAAETLIASAHPTFAAKPVQRNLSSEAEERRKKFMALEQLSSSSVHQNTGGDSSVGSGLFKVYPNHQTIFPTSALQQQQQPSSAQQQQLAAFLQQPRQHQLNSSLQQNPPLNSLYSTASLQGGQIGINQFVNNQELAQPGSLMGGNLLGQVTDPRSDFLQSNAPQQSKASSNVSGVLHELSADKRPSEESKKNQLASFLTASSSSILGEVQSMLASNSSLPSALSRLSEEGKDDSNSSEGNDLVHDPVASIQQRPQNNQGNDLRNERTVPLEGKKGKVHGPVGNPSDLGRDRQSESTDVGRLSAQIGQRKDHSLAAGGVHDYNSTTKRTAESAPTKTPALTEDDPRAMKTGALLQDSKNMKSSATSGVTTGVSLKTTAKQRRSQMALTRESHIDPPETVTGKTRGLDLDPLSSNLIPGTESSTSKLRSGLSHGQSKQAEQPKLKSPPLSTDTSGVLLDHTSAPPAASTKTKLSRGASFLSSIDTFQFSSGGSLNNSANDIGKLEGFGGTPPNTDGSAGGSSAPERKSSAAKKAAFRAAAKREGTLQL